jgi:hypothetical protein
VIAAKGCVTVSYNGIVAGAGEQSYTLYRFSQGARRGAAEELVGSPDQSVEGFLTNEVRHECYEGCTR